MSHGGKRTGAGRKRKKDGRTERSEKAELKRQLLQESIQDAERIFKMLSNFDGTFKKSENKEDYGKWHDATYLATGYVPINTFWGSRVVTGSGNKKKSKDYVRAFRQREKKYPELKIEREEKRLEKQKEKERLKKWLNNVEEVPYAFNYLEDWQKRASYLSWVKEKDPNTLYKVIRSRCTYFYDKKEINSSIVCRMDWWHPQHFDFNKKIWGDDTSLSFGEWKERQANPEDTIERILLEKFRK